MFSRLIGWLLSVVLAFSIGAGVKPESGKTDSELQQKVQEHMDVIIDEAAGIVDDVTEEVRKDERVQRAEEFADDVKEIIDNTREDIDAHFGKKDDGKKDDEQSEAAKDEAPAAESLEEAAEEAAEAVEEVTEEAADAVEEAIEEAEEAAED